MLDTNTLVLLTSLSAGLLSLSALLWFGPGLGRTRPSDDSLIREQLLAQLTEKPIDSVSFEETQSLICDTYRTDTLHFAKKFCEQAVMDSARYFVYVKDQIVCASIELARLTPGSDLHRVCAVRLEHLQSQLPTIAIKLTEQMRDWLVLNQDAPLEGQHFIAKLNTLVNFNMAILEKPEDNSLLAAFTVTDFVVMGIFAGSVIAFVSGLVYRYNCYKEAIKDTGEDVSVGTQKQNTQNESDYSSEILD